MKPTNPIQVIKFAGGQAETLRGGLLDLRKLGQVEVKRCSDIQFDSAKQEHYIEFLDERLKHLNEEYRTKFFPTYELAVGEEVRKINELRLHTDCL